MLREAGRAFPGVTDKRVLYFSIDKDINAYIMSLVDIIVSLDQFCSEYICLFIFFDLNMSSFDIYRWVPAMLDPAVPARHEMACSSTVFQPKRSGSP